MEGYSKDNKPYYFRPIDDEYDDVVFKRCGFINGSWVEFEVDGDFVKFKRTAVNNIDVSGYTYSGHITTSIMSTDYDNVRDRDEKIGEEIAKILGGYASGKEAFSEEFGTTD